MIPEDIPSALSIGKLLQHVIVARAYNSRAKMRFVSEKNSPMPLCNFITRNVCSGFAPSSPTHCLNTVDSPILIGYMDNN